MDQFLRMQELAGIRSSDEDINNLINEAHLMNEGWWESAKYALSKLGRYKAGGKILGKGKVDAESQAKIKDLIRKKGNEIIDQLDDAIKSKLPEFPNNKSQEDFVDMCLEIAKVYDSIVASTKKDPKEEGFLPVDAANVVINDLKEYVKEFLDVKLAAVYSVTNEEQELNEADEEETDSERLKRKKGELTSKTSDTKEKIKSGDLESFDTERLKTLKSWKLPVALLGTGVSFGGLGWLIKALCSDEKEITYKVLQSKAETVADIKPGEGMTQILNRAYDLNLSPKSSPQEFLEAVKKVGGGNVEKGIQMMSEKGGIFKDPAAARDTLEEIARNPNGHGKTLGEIFKGNWAGTGRSAGDTLTTVPGGSLKSMILKWAVKTALIKTGKYTLAAPVLKGLGIGLLGAGLVVALSRWKGRKSSRAQVLNDLYQNLRPIKATEENPIVLPQTPESDKKSQEKEEPTSTGGSTTITPSDVSSMSGLKNRNNQIAFVLGKINPKLNVFAGKDLKDSYLTKLANDPNATEDQKTIGKLILNLRKSPDSFIKKISSSTGITFNQRAKAIATKPGAGTQAQSQTPVKENQMLWESILLEAMIDDVFNKYGISDEDLKANKLGLAALIGSMYASSGNTSLSILSKDQFNDDEKEEVAKLGFSPQPGGNYVFLKTGQTKAQYFDNLQNKNKTQPNVARTSKALTKNASLKSILKRIDTADEFRDLVLAILNNVNPQFVADKSKVKSALFSLRNRIQEADQAKDVTSTIQAVLKDSSIASSLKNIKTVEEVIQLILRDIIPLLNPNLLKDKNKLKNAIIGAANKYNATAAKK